MSAYRIDVREAGKAKPLKQGTAWLLRPDLAVTAFHVVGESSVRAADPARPAERLVEELAEQAASSGDGTG